MEVVKGIPVAPGVVIGPAFILEDVRTRVPRHRVAPGDVPRELDRLDRVWKRVTEDLERDRDRAAEHLGEEAAKIFAFHLGMLHDPTLISPIRARIEEERVTVAYAVSEGFHVLAEQFRAMGSDVFREKAEDIIDLDRRIIGHLVGQDRDRLRTIDEPVVICASSMTPTVAAGLDPERVLAIVIDAGGRTSHTAIVAAGHGVPVVVGARTVSAAANEGDLIAIDGAAGLVVVNPDEDIRRQFELSRVREERRVAAAHELHAKEAITKDGERIRLLGNIEFAREAADVVRYGGDGVGLFRTEFLYLMREVPPTEEEHYEEYCEAVTKLDGRPLTIRTMDLGADKYYGMLTERENNPMLGLRSIRLCLQHLPIFRTQLRAILRASAHGKIKVMFPLISTPMEFRQARMILGDVKEELMEEGIAFDPDIDVGMMVEVPSAAMLASTFAREVSFFSIGTNDLIQYTLAVDRGNERVASLYTGAHPAVIQLVRKVVRAGRRFDIPTSLCGEMAGEAMYVMLLIGIGLRTLSLVPAQIPAVKRIVRNVDIGQCERLARKVGSFDSERRVLRVLRQELDKVIPGGDLPSDSMPQAGNA